MKWFIMLFSTAVMVESALPVQAQLNLPQTPEQVAQDKIIMQDKEDTQKKFELSDTIFIAEFTSKDKPYIPGYRSIILEHAVAIKGDMPSSTVELLLYHPPSVPLPGGPSHLPLSSLKIGTKYLVFAHKNNWNEREGEHPQYYPYFMIPLDENKN